MVEIQYRGVKLKKFKPKKLGVLKAERETRTLLFTHKKLAKKVLSLQDPSPAVSVASVAASAACGFVDCCNHQTISYRRLPLNDDWIRIHKDGRDGHNA
jgi:hypothetical protein